MPSMTLRSVPTSPQCGHGRRPCGQVDSFVADGALDRYELAETAFLAYRLRASNLEVSLIAPLKRCDRVPMATGQ